MNLHEAFKRVLEGSHLTEDEAYEAMLDLTSGTQPPELVSGFTVALRIRKESAAEVAGFARAMRRRAITIAPRVPGRLIDTCGTGGAPVKSFNISTACAFVAAAGGAYVAKHGNRSVTRPSGSADVLAALGADLQLPPERVQQIIEEVGVGFLLAPSFHPALKNAASTRNALQVRTVFNLLGPLCNPAGAKGQVLGVFDPDLVEFMAEVLARLGTEHALVLNGQGMDEATLAGPTRVAEVRDGRVHKLTLEGARFGFPHYDAKEWAPLTPPDSARTIREILGGHGKGPRRAIVEYNAGLSLYVAGRAPSIEAGIVRAREILDTDEALKKLDEFVHATRAPGAGTP